MKVIDNVVMPDGTKIVLQDWTENNTKDFPDLYGMCIAAYPIAKNTGKYKFIHSGETFALMIGYNKYAGYTNENVLSDFEALKNGTKTLFDLADHFNNGNKDKWYLGMDVEYQGW